jgi:hypothetical protein
MLMYGPLGVSGLSLSPPSMLFSAGKAADAGSVCRCAIRPGLQIDSCPACFGHPFANAACAC